MTGFVLRSTAEAIEEHRIDWESKTLLDLDDDDLGVLDENVSKMNEFSKVLIVQAARIHLKINAKKTKPLRLGIREGERDLSI